VPDEYDLRTIQKLLGHSDIKRDKVLLGDRSKPHFIVQAPWAACFTRLPP
jgi:hypothetical protein